MTPLWMISKGETSVPWTTSDTTLNASISPMSGVVTPPSMHPDALPSVSSFTPWSVEPICNDTGQVTFSLLWLFYNLWKCFSENMCIWCTFLWKCLQTLFLQTVNLFLIIPKNSALFLTIPTNSAHFWQWLQTVHFSWQFPQTVHFFLTMRYHNN